MFKFLIGSFCLLICSVFVAGDISLREYYPGNITVEHNGYALQFNQKLGVPSFVIYRISPTPELGLKRDGMTFKKDPSIPNTPAPGIYAKSGYDLGHMCNVDDKESDLELMRETFFTSNCCPQLPSLNRGDWRELEAMLHKETIERGPPHFIIICGPIFYPQTPIVMLDSKVAIPHAFFKVCYNEQDKTIRAWIFPHENRNGKPNDYRSTLDTIEKQTKLKFKTF